MGALTTLAALELFSLDSWKVGRETEYILVLIAFYLNSLYLILLHPIVNSQYLLTVGNCLLATLNPTTQKQGIVVLIIVPSYNCIAEQQLTTYESSIPNFPIILLPLVKPKLIAQLGLPSHVDIPAVLLLKNLIKRHWMVRKKE